MLHEPRIGANGIGRRSLDQRGELVGLLDEVPRPFKGFSGRNLLDFSGVSRPPSLEVGIGWSGFSRACSYIRGGMGGGVRFIFIGGAGKGGLCWNFHGGSKDLPRNFHGISSRFLLSALPITVSRLAVSFLFGGFGYGGFYGFDGNSNRLRRGASFGHLSDQSRNAHASVSRTLFQRKPSRLKTSNRTFSEMDLLMSRPRSAQRGP